MNIRSVLQSVVTRRSRSRESSRSGELRTGLFVILSSPGAGGDVLAKLIRHDSDVLCHDGIFSSEPHAEGFHGAYDDRVKQDKTVRAKLSQLRMRDPAVYIYKIAFHGQGRSHVGFTVNPHDILQPRFAGVRTVLLADTDIRVICITRRNPLKGYLSALLADRRSSSAADPAGVPSVGQLAIDVRACIADMERVGRQEAYVRRMFRHHSVLDLIYESVTASDGADVLSRMQQFLGLTATNLRVIDPWPTEAGLDAIQNHQEVQESLSGTPYATFLED